MPGFAFKVAGGGVNSIHPAANIPNASYDLLMKSTSGGETIDPNAAQFDVSVSESRKNREAA